MGYGDYLDDVVELAVHDLIREMVQKAPARAMQVRRPQIGELSDPPERAVQFNDEPRGSARAALRVPFPRRPRLRHSFRVQLKLWQAHRPNPV